MITISMIGISSSGYTNDCSIRECMKQIRNAGYDSVDLNLYDFCQPDGPMATSDWKKWVSDARQAIRDAGLIVGQIHALFGLFATTNLIYEPRYLMPRLDKYGAWAPFINVVLFSLYHFFSPWQNIERILAILPLGYAVWWKKNVYISIYTHCIVNTA